MSIVLVGLNHQTASVALREQMALAGCKITDRAGGLPTHNGLSALPHDLQLAGGIHDSLILSTCNRLEIYATSGDPSAAVHSIVRFLSGLQGLADDQLRSHLYIAEDEAAAEHLMRVACGLDSMVLGESQILGQVAEAFARAQGAGTTGLVLTQLATRAMRAGKRARNETDISRHTTSVSHAAARLARQRLGDLGEARVLIIGAGEMAELAATALHDEGAQHLTVINRTYAHAERLAQRFDGRAYNWYHLSRALAEADLVISATGAPHPVIRRGDVASILERRNGAPLVIVDVALPRDVEHEVSELSGVLRFDIDDLNGVVDANLAQREAAIPAVETIIQQELDEFLCWLRGREVVPVLVDLRRKVESLAAGELDTALRRLDGADPQAEEAMRLLVHRIVGKLLHEPTVRLKSEAANGNGVAYADALREMFALGDEPAGIPAAVNGVAHHA
ncbi:MAG: glutamyl-tRNA reductase [Anaerolineae bacterium]|nr:glutamyl-tRNA reductase [Anaerolineae bacterium]